MKIKMEIRGVKFFLVLISGIYEKKVKGWENFDRKFKGCENIRRKFKGYEKFSPLRKTFQPGIRTKKRPAPYTACVTSRKKRHEDRLFMHLFD